MQVHHNFKVAAPVGDTWPNAITTTYKAGKQFGNSSLIF